MYAPNIESQYEAFLEEVEVALGKATSSESLVLLGDFNAHVGIDNATWKGVIGQHGDPDINKNGKCLLQFCATNGLCIMNTFFQHKRIHKYTWYRDSLGQRSLIDFCIVSADLFSTVTDVRVKKAYRTSYLNFELPSNNDDILPHYCFLSLCFSCSSSFLCFLQTFNSY